MRGGTLTGANSVATGEGRSPRARGNPRSNWRSRSTPGTIPACAGEPTSAIGVALVVSRLGRSPRARGNHEAQRRRVRASGTIPACAGEPICAFRAGVCVGDDPRVRGGTVRPTLCVHHAGGRSPRARGNHNFSRAAELAKGTIPACAGEPFCHGSSSLLYGDDPRVRGGTRFGGHTSSGARGRSPRARGNRTRSGVALDRWGTIPACAGEPRSPWRSPCESRDDPRVRGGTMRTGTAKSAISGRSPRARGNLPLEREEVRGIGTIPACAGEPRTACCHRSGRRDDPRVRGGTDR